MKLSPEIAAANMSLAVMRQSSFIWHNRTYGGYSIYGMDEIVTTVNDNITIAEPVSGQRFGTDALCWRHSPKIAEKQGG